MYYMCNDTLCNITIDEQEVLDIISVLPVNKAIGPDCIYHKMLESNIFTIVKPLTMLFNRSLSEKVFPSFWKLDHVIPLFKKDVPSVVSNYRPVSLLSCVSNIMERMCTIIFIVMVYFINIKQCFCLVILLYTNC